MPSHTVPFDAGVEQTPTMVSDNFGPTFFRLLGEALNLDEVKDQDTVSIDSLLFIVLTANSHEHHINRSTTS